MPPSATRCAASFSSSTSSTLSRNLWLGCGRVLVSIGEDTLCWAQLSGTVCSNFTIYSMHVSRTSPLLDCSTYLVLELLLAPDVSHVLHH